MVMYRQRYEMVTHCIGMVLLLSMLCSSCKKFLQEEPAGFIPAPDFYKTPEQVLAAVNGTYAGLDDPFVNDIGVAESSIYPLEYITGYSKRPNTSGTADNEFLLLQGIDPANQRLEAWWTAIYYPLENCNSAIAHLKVSDIIDEETKRHYLGEVYFLRAYYYFRGVRLFGDIPLKTTPTVDFNDVQIGKSPTEDIYNQIVSDLQLAEQAGLPWTDNSGRITTGAIKSLLAQVYLTMAGYPLQKGNFYYNKAYETAKEVIDHNSYYLFDTYADLRRRENQNTGEHIFMLQRDPVNAPNDLHFSLLPYPAQPISIAPDFGGAMQPRQEFYDAYGASDIRKQNRQFFYTSYPKYDDPGVIIQLNAPYLYKYWDEEGEKNGRSGANIPLIRYADILLVCAEAKAGLDGGSTADPTAIDAWYAVHQRAIPAATRPATITTDMVLKERFLELCYEFTTWYDMLRTHKALDVVNGTVTGMIGYQAPNHIRPFKASDLLWPIPLSEVQKNPKLK